MNPPEPISTAAAKLIFVKLVLKVFKLFNKIGAKKIKQWNTENKAKKLFIKISKVGKVKTLWQVDRPVNIKSFFCEPHILYDGKRYRVNNVSEMLITNRNIVIEGIAGQGKSIFLRHLCVKELERGEYIPIFIELRKIEIEKNLIDLILFAFKELGLDIDINQFNVLADTGKVVLFLDAFDEIGEESKLKILNEIEMLCSTLSLLKIVVSTRPDSPIIMSPFFRVFKIDHIKGDEYIDLINKLSSSKSSAKVLIDQIKIHEGDVVPLLCTPLLITLYLFPS